jgi:hypothetical protein
MAESSNDYFVYTHLRCIKFNGLNQAIWYKGIKDILMLANAFDLLTKREPKPVVTQSSSKEDKDALASYEDRYRKAVSIIKGSLHDSQDYYLGDRQDLFKMWDALMETVKRRKSHADLTDYGTFNLSRWNPGDSLESYLNRIKGLKARLDETDINIKESLLIAHILYFLPKEWNLQNILSANYKTLAEVEIALNDIKSAVQPREEVQLLQKRRSPGQRLLDETEERKD